MGSDGLRAGWGVLLFIVLYLVFFFLVSWVFRSYLAAVRHCSRVARKAGADHGSRAAVCRRLWQPPSWRSSNADPCWHMDIRARRGLYDSSPAWSGASSRFRYSCLVLWKARLLAFDGIQLHGGAIFKYALGWGLMFLMVAVFEESTLRGYLQFTLTRGIGFWWGALLLSLLFGFSHGTNPGETPVGLFGAAGIGLVFCLSLWYTGSLWWALGCPRQLGLGRIVFLWHVG